MKNIMKLLGCLLLVLLLAACGGGGGSPGVTPGAVVGAIPLAAPASIEIFSSSAQLSSATGSSASFTVLVKDANNQAIPNQTVTFAANSGNLSGALPVPKTGPAGEPITSVALFPGTDQSNRSIVVTATAGGIIQSITIAVQGTTLSLTGDPSVLSGGTTTFTAKAQDSTGRPVAGASLAIASALNNFVSFKTVVTDAQGGATFSYVGINAGADTITISGLGTSAKAPVSISLDDFRFETPVANVSVPVGSSQIVTVRFVSGGAPIAGRQVTFSSTRGTISVSSAVTDANGRASTLVSSSTSGPASVIAQLTSAQATLPIVFVATTPASVVLQANPGAVVPNAGSSTLNQSALQAIVRDGSGNPVPGKVVNFTAITDGSNGTISPGSGTTDANGSVVAQFIPGALTTAANGVAIQATVQGTAIFGTATLTVSGQALFIAIASGNVISNLNVTTYQKEFSVYVTDANGAPAANRVVNLSVFPHEYGKGTLSYSILSSQWVYSAGSPIWCPNEDKDKNGILNPGEDTSKDGRLTPGLPVVISPAFVTTGANGFATFFLQYGENFYPWLKTTLTARASVGGTESVQTQIYVIEAVSSDVTSETNPPQGTISPFGTGSCTTPN